MTEIENINCIKYVIDLPVSAGQGLIKSTSSMWRLTETVSGAGGPLMLTAGWAIKYSLAALHVEKTAKTD